MLGSMCHQHPHTLTVFGKVVGKGIEVVVVVHSLLRSRRKKDSNVEGRDWNNFCGETSLYGRTLAPLHAPPCACTHGCARSRSLAPMCACACSHPPSHLLAPARTRPRMCALRIEYQHILFVKSSISYGNSAPTHIRRHIRRRV